MATYVTEDSLDQGVSDEDIKEMMVGKAHELFIVCDKEEKGFITKRDMQRLQNELPLTPEQLEDVFDSLDDDGNGYLTLQEFTEGFGSFLGLATTDNKGSHHSLNSVGSDERIYEDGTLANEDENFNDMLNYVGAKEVFDDMDTIKTLWEKLKLEQPELLGSFENFLGRVTTDIKRSQNDFQSLESALRTKSSAHDEEVRKLYEEMEQQIKVERERVITEEKAKERQLKEEMEKELQEKDRQLQELLLKHQDMEDRLQSINQVEAETKQENEKLAKERDKLENLLEHSQDHLEESRTYISELRQKQRHDKRDRAMAAMQISEGIALERESLVKQLDMLREMNRKLRDERDEADIRRMSHSIEKELDEVGDRLGKLHQCDTCDEMDEDSGDGGRHTHSHSSSTNNNRPIRENSMDSRRLKFSKRGGQGSVMSDYMGDSGSMSSLQNSAHDESVEFDDADLLALDANHNLHSSPYPSPMNTAQTAEKQTSHQSSSNNSSNYNHMSGQKLDSIDPIMGSHYQQNDLSLITNGELIDDLDLVSSSDTATISTALTDATNTPNISRSLDQQLLQNQKDTNRLPNGNLASSFEVSDSEYSDSGKSRLTASHLTNNNHKRQGADHDSDVDNFTSHGRTEPVGANSCNDNTDGFVSANDPAFANRTPERLFKVVFVGDSGVGKSCFIHRFCNDTFRHTFSATIGVDFQVKNVVVDGHLIALQLWDTAGQERFRSITKQYFRKADGVIVMYDVTSETSFKNVQNWMVSVQEGVDEGTVLTLVGNKMDLIDDYDENRLVSTKAGSRLADDYGALFYETSAKSGLYCREAMHGMASLLQEREDHQIEKSFNVGDDTVPKKKPCCGD